MQAHQAVAEGGPCPTVLVGLEGLPGRRLEALDIIRLHVPTPHPRRKVMEVPVVVGRRPEDLMLQPLLLLVRLIVEEGILAQQKADTMAARATIPTQVTAIMVAISIVIVIVTATATAIITDRMTANHHTLNTANLIRGLPLLRRTETDTIDPNSQSIFYWDPVTRQSQWERPRQPAQPPPISQLRPLPGPEWVEVLDESTGRFYLWNEKTDAVAWRVEDIK
ncbi:Pre-mRNA-processing protein 40C [Hondaea fermentalgiana]|uniref:Pre-mRNA-processing protein 40C n=1 Tax=Hondaea fermentalgiana TaxID=2315210 RepID=A0A2R5GXL0_9STRA|nr:Pre-mRNA-processing protein 40C [Hondaea fermentalgiana]|eukprot:GBG33151.1 Pre-mRNA-processing protein 40C [Hondaea fermentalgiana]